MPKFCQLLQRIFCCQNSEYIWSIKRMERYRNQFSTTSMTPLVDLNFARHCNAAIKILPNQMICNLIFALVFWLTSWSNSIFQNRECQISSADRKGVCYTHLKSEVILDTTEMMFKNYLLAITSWKEHSWNLDKSSALACTNETLSKSNLWNWTFRV